MRKLASHRNVCTLYSRYIYKYRAFLVMELCETDLRSLIIRQGGRVSKKVALTIGAALARTVALMHSENVIHFDLKARNVLFRRVPTSAAECRQYLRICDLGLAKLEGAEGIVGSTGGGTYTHQTPEQFWGLQSNADLTKVDVYGLGVVLWELLTGERPWKGKTKEEVTRAVCEGKRPSLKKIGHGQRWLLKWMWDEDPSKRPTAEKCAEVLEAQALNC
uniref:Protein kinase domain-containing protein n=1 Tax=Chromera velia CCMP2878 TaxID=1169474 RepID=A0A0G4I2B6_9ALVE|eukprot:Cvel_10346.t1-p1 / transcript=Cvel_10346.t1 / gene=Cvel_10346 / organism=Chromera_velia_CCMP2878 / gene_product=CDPK-related kinase 5, putative / transcript_product=CDPK-related kinase 5, putative / location=Cvel_scaffold622:451-1981(+) / protein_length=218 / sequence_SO=supercontig / SO=protein_coding / is_pseudo=false